MKNVINYKNEVIVTKIYFVDFHSNKLDTIKVVNNGNGKSGYYHDVVINTINDAISRVRKFRNINKEIKLQKVWGYV